MFGQSVNINSISNLPNQPYQPCWHYPLSDPSNRQIASDNKEGIYFIRDNKYIDSINKTDGKSNWTFDAGGAIVSRVLVNPEFIYIANSITKSVSRESVFIFRSISKYSGLTFWKTEIKFDADSQNNEVASENTYVYETKDGLLLNSNFCFVHINKLDGTLRWKKCLADGSANYFVMSDILSDTIAFSDNVYIYLFAVNTGEVLSKIPVETQVTAISLFDKSTVIYGDKKGIIRSVNVESGKTYWTVKSGGEITGIVKAGKGLLVTSFDNFIYMLDKTSGRKIWKRRLANRVKEKPSVRENTKENGKESIKEGIKENMEENVAVVVSGDENAVFIDISSGRIINQISLPSGSYFLSSPVFIGKYYFFLTNKGIVAFTDDVCSTNDSGLVLKIFKTNPLFYEKV
jgi:outer membrane protein assembly factor BamB